MCKGNVLYLTHSYLKGNFTFKKYRSKSHLHDKFSFSSRHPFTAYAGISRDPPSGSTLHWRGYASGASTHETGGTDAGYSLLATTNVIRFPTPSHETGSRPLVEQKLSRSITATKPRNCENRCSTYLRYLIDCWVVKFCTRLICRSYSF